MRVPSPAMVVSFVALLVALGGTAYAVVAPPPKSVGTKQLKKNAVGAKKIKRGAVTSAKVRDGSLREADFGAGQLPAGPAGPAGPKGDAGAAGADATKLWAKVEATGPSIVRSSGATGLEFLGAGTYRIAFDRDVSACVPVASIAADDGAVPPNGQIGVTNSVANVNAVAATTYDGAGVANDARDFVIAVLC